MQLDSLQYLFFGGQDLCAPEDDAFQAWLSSIPNTSGPTCSVVAISIDGSVVDQTFTEGIAITPLVLPEAGRGYPAPTCIRSIRRHRQDWSLVTPRGRSLEPQR